MNDQDIYQATVSTINESTGSPFLFVGSGFSRRYLDLPKWDDLLKLFCKDEEEFSMLRASSNGNLPLLASQLADIYHERWWNSPDFTDNRLFFKEKSNGEILQNKTSALRWEICQYLSNLSNRDNFNLPKEIDALKNINIDGIITTNWDKLLEKIFPEYKIYIGQEDLLFSDTQAIGEIYKIHGCASSIESLVLTQEDYNNFHKLNPYLAAKLITIFVEHPIIFIGYSMSDKNIVSLLSSIVTVLNQEKLEKLSKNLIFLQRADGKPPSFTGHTLHFDGRSIPATLIKTDNFKTVYEAISKFEKKIPVRLIRLYKKQFYEIVSSNQPSKRMHVINESTIDENSQIQVVVGLTVATDAAGKIGYKGINLQNLFEDFLEDKGYRSDLILSDTLTNFPMNIKYIPIFKHLKNTGIKTKHDLFKSKINIHENKLPLNGAQFYQTSSYQQSFIRDAKKLSAAQIIEKFEPNKAVFMLPYLQKNKIDIQIVKEFLKKNKNTLLSKDAKSTAFRKLACYIDWIENGFSF